MSKTVLIIGFVVLLIGAYLYDEWVWRVRPREALIEIVREADWRLHGKALAELRRRGDDLNAYLPRFLPLLAAGTKTERVAAQSLVRKFYPSVARELKGYSPIADAEACRETIGPLLARYPAQPDT